MADVGRWASRVGRHIRAHLSLIVVATMALLLLDGSFASISGLGALEFLALAALPTTLILGSLRKLQPPPPRVNIARFKRDQDLEIGLLFVITTFVLVSLTGGLTSPLVPLIYVLVTYLIVFHHLTTGILLVLSTIVLILVLAQKELLTHPDRWASQVGFVLLFSFINALLMRVEIFRQRRLTEKEVARALHRNREEAKEYRLIGTIRDRDFTRDRQEEEDLLRQSSVEELRRTFFHYMSLLRRSMDLHTAILLWIDDTNTLLKIRECNSLSDKIVEGAIRVGDGALAEVFRQGRPLRLEDKRGLRAVSYYIPGEVTVRVMAAVPVREGTMVRGILAVDRVECQAFSDADMALLTHAAEQVWQTLTTERLLMDIAQSKYQQERFYQAMEQLSHVVKLDEVLDCALEMSQELVKGDVTVMTLIDPALEVHRIVRAAGTGAEDLLGKEFDYVGKSLVQMAARTGHVMPYGGQWDNKKLVFARGIRFPPMTSLYVFPLKEHDNTLGTLTVGASRPNAFNKEMKDMLKVIATHQAVSLAKASLVQRLEEMATTDGLTGLTNRRRMDEKFLEMLDRASRFQRNLTIIMSDVDHFKSVNDTYGHQVGDEVLRVVAKVLKKNVRRTDVAARYGGEELVMLLEESDAEGGFQMAERIRTEVAAVAFESEKGAFHVTISMGLATFPPDGQTPAELFQRADMALYYAKQNGRNQAHCISRLRPDQLDRLMAHMASEAERKKQLRPVGATATNA